MAGYYFLRYFSLSEERSFGLDTSSVMLEKVPLVISPAKSYGLRRVDSAPEGVEFPRQSAE